MPTVIEVAWFTWRGADLLIQCGTEDFVRAQHAVVGAVEQHRPLHFGVLGTSSSASTARASADPCAPEGCRSPVVLMEVQGDARAQERRQAKRAWIQEPLKTPGARVF